MARKKIEDPFTIENGISFIAIIISLLALTLLMNNKPVIGGYTELNCHKTVYEDGSSACIVKLDSYSDRIKVFKESRQ